MKLLKIFIKDCFGKCWFWVSSILTVFTICSSYFEFFKELKYMTQMLYVSIIISCIATCFSLYRKIAKKYPEILIQENKKLRFNDICTEFEVKKVNRRITYKYKIDIMQDVEKFFVDNCYSSGVTLKLYNKISIRNLKKEQIELCEPRIYIYTVNNVENKFFIDRLKVNVDKVKFTKSRYVDWYNWMKKDELYKFPYIIKGKEQLDIFFYSEVGIDSNNDKQFDELLKWIRNINFKIDIPFKEKKSNRIFNNTFIIKYNFKKDLLKNMISKKNRDDEELDIALNKLLDNHTTSY